MEISKAMLATLKTMIDADGAGQYEDAEIVCEGRSCWLGDRQVSRATVNSLLCMLVISDASDSGGIERYTVNEVGRALLQHPELAPRIAKAIAEQKPFSVSGDTIVLL